MAYRIKAASIWHDSKKIGMAESGDITFEESGELEFADFGEGHELGSPDGIIRTNISLQTIVAVSGETANLTLSLLHRRYVRLVLETVDGFSVDVVARHRSVRYQWEHKTGTQRGTFDFQGGKPLLTVI